MAHILCRIIDKHRKSSTKVSTRNKADYCHICVLLLDFTKGKWYNKPMKNKVTINNLEIGYKKINSEDYISITDMAKFRNPEHTGLVISNWLRTRYTIEFMGIWEKINNPDFNVLEFEYIKN